MITGALAKDIVKENIIKMEKTLNQTQQGMKLILEEKKAYMKEGLFDESPHLRSLFYRYEEINSIIDFYANKINEKKIVEIVKSDGTKEYKASPFLTDYNKTVTVETKIRSELLRLVEKIRKERDLRDKDKIEYNGIKSK
jgi:hypothetical protein